MVVSPDPQLVSCVSARQLARAIAAEDYSMAAGLRDELAGMAVDEQMAIISVNAEFYAAFPSGSIRSKVFI